MKLGITTKLFVGVFATSLLALLAMAVTGRVMFTRDFSHYVEASENRRLEALAVMLAGIYSQTGDWSSVEGSEGRWHAIVRSAPRSLDGDSGEVYGWPYLALYDNEDHPIVGFVGADGDIARHPVIANDRVVGWIARKRWVAPSAEDDLSFMRTQVRNLAVATLAALLLAALAAALLSRSFLAPARIIGAAHHRLAAGAFDTRVKVKSEDEFGRLGDDFNLLARTLQRNDEMRRRMMADVAHELRTPLAIIQGELHALEDGVRQPTPETLASLRAEALALGKLVDDLYQLSLSDLGALDYRRSDLDLREQVANALQSARGRCVAAGLEIDDSELGGQPLLVHADPDRIGRLLANLLENSIRYTDPPGKIRVYCGESNGNAMIQIDDTPPGVAEAFLPRLFERFFRMEGSRNRASGGAGLGLAICRNIVEAHYGQIFATSSSLGGLKIIVQLPLLRSGS